VTGAGSAPSPTPPRSDEDIVAEHELIRLAGFDLDHYLTLPEHQQRLVLKTAEQLVNAQRRAAPEA
jgi:hypothetical protein